MKDTAKLVLKYLMRFTLKVFWLFPVRKRTVFFMANMGKGYLCNPKYIYESMKNDDRFKAFHYIWCFKDPDAQDRNKFSNNTTLVKKDNLFVYFYYLLTSEIIVYNCGGFSYAPIRKKQLLIETGHGGGLWKRNGFLEKNKSSSSKKGLLLADKDIKLWLSSDEKHSEMYIRQAMGYSGEILDSGYPRSDILFKDNTKLISEVRKKLRITEDSHVVLYAPTFKGREDQAVSISSGSEIISVEKVKNVLSERFGGDWIFVTRGHQYSQDVSIDEIDADWTSYPDMQELLLVADVLITDYSSSIWDFSILKKPCFLYVPDLSYYETHDRGFYIPISKWPALIVQNNDEWERTIRSYDREQYIARVENYLTFMGSFENGHACEKVLTEVLLRVKQGGTK